jgi:hypothetical protein
MHIQSEAEEIVEGNRPPTNWPVAGKVEIKDLKVIDTLFYECVKLNIQKKIGVEMNYIIFLFVPC